MLHAPSIRSIMLHAPSIRSIEMVLALECSDNKNKDKKSKRIKFFLKRL